LLGAPITDLHDVVSTANHLTVFGTAPGLLIRLSAVVGPSPADEAWFRLVGGTEIASVHVPSSHSGASGIGTFVEPGLRITVEFAFESTHRSALSYASRILGERIVPTDLTDFLQLATSDSDDTAQFVH
jgi:hypothetical protein